MADRLPPDLARLGDELTSAAARAVGERRRRAERRRRFAIAALAGALGFMALMPGALDPAHRQPVDLGFVAEAEGFPPPGCDHPRGAQFRMPKCKEAMVLHRPYAWR